MAVTKNLGRVTFVNRGAYSASATYNRLDLVTYGGGTWCALQTVKGVSPVSGAYWMVIAERGDKGETGATGDNITVDSVTPSNKNVTLDALKYTPMNLTSAQKAETRSNINAQEKLVIDTELSSVSENIVENSAITEAADEISEKLEDGKADAAWDDVQSVDIVSISDGADDVPVRALSVGMEPVQDLHGYENPWPAGGGKNLYPFDNVTNKFVNNSGVISTASNPKQYCGFEDKVPVTGGEDYVIAIFGASDPSAIYYGEWDADGVFLGRQHPTTVTGTGCRYAAITASANAASIFAYAYDSNAPYSSLTGIKGYIQIGSTAPNAWSPYENICPISGRTGVTAFRTGVNVWDEEWEVGGLTSGGVKNYSATSRIVSKNYIPVLPLTQYYFHDSNGFNRIMAFYDASKTFLSVQYGNGIFTTPQDAAYVLFSSTNDNYGSVYNHDISINYPSTDTAYHAYTGTSYPVTWQTEAGTVYGGTVDVVSGVLTVTRAKVDLGGLTGWVKGNRNSDDNAYIYRRDFTDGAYLASPILSSAFRLEKEGTFVWESISYGCMGWQATEQGFRLLIALDSANTTAFRQDVSGVQFVYPLTTPQTYQLTPTQIQTLLGVNNVWADCGPIVNFEYVADTKLYIDGKFAALLAIASES